jgi:hypothetical protein
LTNLPGANLPYRFYTGDSLGAGMDKIHALHIDTTKGFVYCFGGTLNSAYAFDLKPDPYHPHYAGRFTDLDYVHDGFADNDTLYAAHIYAGLFSIVDMTDKAHPNLINTQPTPGQFTHNTWLTDDHKTLMTTDEVDNSYLASYDISDPTNIRFLDKIQSNPGSYSVVHNTHVRNNYAVSSWYKDGFTIVDVSRPGNLVQVGNYDTYGGSGGGSAGCWGVYPFFPSGTIIASNIKGFGSNNGELYILSPKYIRGCYLEGLVTDAVTGFPIINANVKIVGTQTLDSTSANGRYAVGQVTPGLFTVQVTKPGYQPFQTEVTLENGVLTPLDVALYPIGGLTIKGTVYQTDDVTPVPGAAVWLYGLENTYSGITNVSGMYSISGVFPGLYSIAAAEQDQGLAMKYNQSLISDSTINLSLVLSFRRDGVLPVAEQIPQTSVDIYPNPFSNQTSVLYSVPGNNQNLRVIDAFGRLMETFTLQDSRGSITLGANYPPGLYCLQFGSEYVAKFIKR